MSAPAVADPSTPNPSTANPVVRPVTDWKTRAIFWGLEHAEPVCAALRTIVPILTFGKTAVLTRHDDIKEVFLSDAYYGVPYKRKMDVLLGGPPFFLDMQDTEEYRRQTDAMREVVRIDDVATRIVPAAQARAAALIAAAGGRIEVVEMVRKATFEVLLDYFGLPEHGANDVEVWSTRLFEFQFADSKDDPVLDGERAAGAPAGGAPAPPPPPARRASGAAKDDVLGRCLKRQAEGDTRYSDEAIRCALIGFIAGGVPQLPMAGPQMIEQLLRRPTALATAARAARADDDPTLGACLLEALRFDPMARILPRVGLVDHTVAAGTRREKVIHAGTDVILWVASGMMDPRRLDQPHDFRASRPPSAYMHFGCGHHECFGIHINRAILPAVLKPLLRTPNLRRAPGAAGRLRKQGLFAESLTVLYERG